jgi:outer membrane receptor protein involved in Fe transport
VLDTVSVQRGRDLLKLGVDYNYLDYVSGALPLHFGGRYVFGALPAIPGVLPAPVSSIQAVALGLPAAYVQGYGDPTLAYATQDLSLFAQYDWSVGSDLTVKAGVRYQSQYWPSTLYNVPGLAPYTFPTNHSVAPRLATAWTPNGSRNVSLRAAYGTFHDNHLTGLTGVADIVDGKVDGVRTLVSRFPATLAAWNAPGHKLSENAAGTFPSLIINVAPEFAVPYAHHAMAGVTWQLLGQASFNADFIYVRGMRQVGTLDYNPVVPSLGPNRRPGDLVIGGVPVAGTSASVLQYTGFGDTWYKGLAVSLSKRLADRYQFLVSYTVSEAEDTSTDYQTAFLPEDTGRGRDPSDPTGLPIGFDALKEKGPSLEDQTHRFVVSGMTQLPGQIFVSAIVTAGSGRPYNILAGTDLNGDGNGGAFPPDRPRTVLEDPQTSIGRNLGILPSLATTDVRVSRRFQLKGMRTIEAIFEVFNLFNRTNFTEANPVFGTGSYPTNPLPTFGQFEKAAPPRQAQIALRLQL